MKGSFKNYWTDILLFLLASLWTVAGIYLAVNVVIDNQEITRINQVIELLVFLNLAVLMVYSGFKTQLRLFNEWTSAKNN